VPLFAAAFALGFGGLRLPLGIAPRHSRSQPIAKS
jgi:hypothetical protein